MDVLNDNGNQDASFGSSTPYRNQARIRKTIAYRLYRF